MTDKKREPVTYENSVTIGPFTATKNNQGIWRLEPGDASLTTEGILTLSPDSWKDGDYLISVIAEDQAGNQSRTPKELYFDIDAVLTPPRITLDAESDSGDSNSDKLTNETAPIFNLTDIDLDTTTLIITVKKGDNIVETITAKRKVTGSHKEPKPEVWDITVTDQDGNQLDSQLASLTEKGTDWQLTLSQQLKHGEYQLTIESEDRAGNKSSDLNIEAPSSLNLTIDTEKPPAPPMCLVKEQERGESKDHLTNVSTPIFMLDLNDLAEDVTKITIKVTDKADKEVQYSNSDENIGTITATRNAAGEWTLTPSGGTLTKDGKLSLSSNKWKDDDYKLVVKAHDKAGNISEKPTLFEFNLDTQLTLPGILLDTASDTGDNASDNITRITKPTFNLTGIDDDLVNISIKVTNDQEKIISTLTATRKVTKNGATEWSVQPSGAVLKNTEGHWQIILENELPDGEYNVNIETEDRAGNKSSDEHRKKPNPLVIHIDTDLSTPTISLDSGSDSGEKDNDNLTNKTEPVFNLSHIDNDITTLTITVRKGDNIVETIIATREVGTKKEPQPKIWTFEVKNAEGHKVDNGKVELTGASKDWKLTLSQALKHGEYQLSIDTEDRAGNKSSDDNRNKPASLVLTIDIEAPDAPPISLQTDSGVPNDNLTNIIKPIFDLDISKLANDVNQITIKVTDNNRQAIKYKDSEEQIEEMRLKKNDQGQWVLNDAVLSLSKDNKKLSIPTTGEWQDGDYILSVIAEDKAGNLSHRPAELDFAIDTALNTPSITLFQPEGSLVKNELRGKLTNEIPPKFTLSNIDDDVINVVVTVSYKNKAGDTKNIDIDASGTNGNWSVTLPADDSLGEGDYTLVVKVEDKAGNEKTSANLAIRVNATLITPLIKLVQPEDSLVKEELKETLTNKSPPNFLLDNIDKEVNTVTVTILNQASAKKEITAGRQEDGSWHFDFPAEWAEGKYTLSVKVLDDAGNQKTSDKIEVCIDTTPPVLPTIQLEENSNTGAEFAKNENLTNQEKPCFVFSNISEDVSRLQVVIKDPKGNQQTVEIQKEPTEDWRFQPKNNWTQDGEYTLTVIAIDDAGNKSDSSDALTVIFDKTAPASPRITLEERTGAEGFERENLTNKNPPTFRLADIDEDVTFLGINISGQNTQIITATRQGKDQAWQFEPASEKLSLAKKGSDWLLTLDGELAQGESSVNVIAIDRAGNLSELRSLDFEIDSELAAPIIEIDEKTYEGNRGSNNVTKNTLPIFTLKNIADDVIHIELQVTGKKEGTSTTITATKREGKWHFAPSDNGLVFNEEVWRFTPKTAWVEDRYTLALKVKDKASNTATSDSITLDIKTTPPPKPNRPVA